MKTSRYLLALLSVALAAPAGLAAQGFEGTMKQTQVVVMPSGVAALAGPEATDAQKVLAALTGKVKSADPSYLTTTDMTVTVKGTKMRIDGMGGPMGADAYAVMDAGAGIMYTVMPAQKQIMTLSAAEAPLVARRIGEQMGMTAPATPAAPVTTDLGVKTIGTVKAHGYRVATADGVAIVWVDPAMKNAFDGFKDFQEKMTAMNPGTGPVQAAIMALGFPIQTEFVVKAPPMMGEGFLYTRQEVSQVEKQPVADGVFALPADFNKISMAQMMGINP